MAANPDTNRQACARWRERNLSREQTRSRERNRRLRGQHQEAMNERKRGGCADCGTREGELHFHHLDPSTKLFVIADGWAYTADRLALELAKCVVVCEPCHDERHRQITNRR